MRNSNVTEVVFISVLFALLVHCPASAFNLSAQKARGDARINFELRGGAVSGFFYATLHVGGGEYYLHFDTASSLTWIQCAGEHALEAPNPPYQPQPHNYIAKNDPRCPSYSDHAENQICDFQLSYHDGGYSSGLVVRDVVPFYDSGSNSHLHPSLIFGCGHYQDPDHDDHIRFDGVLGLGKERSSFPSQLHSLGHTSNFFGHCLSSYSHGARSGFGFYGRGNIAQLSHGVVWFPMLELDDHYAIGPATITVDGVPHQMNVPYIILDTGSTFTVFDHPIYTAIDYMVKMSLHQSNAPLHLLDHVHDGLSVCWRGPRHFSSINLAKQYFQPIKLGFTENRIIELQPEDYLRVTYAGHVCMVIMDSHAHANAALNVLGASSMLDKVVMYDNRRNRIGWGAHARGSCLSTAST